ncbi:MAG: hypothetical protein LQ338_006079 [Usnochroma carphineum]|nr:MAG: hypothetical protein LQ338_006079 [Usnochroma carphineum]
MSSRKTPSDNPFEPLSQPDEDVAMTRAPQQTNDTAGLQVSTLQQTLPQIPPKQDPSKKRPAQSPPAAGRQKFSLSMLNKKIKTTDALVAQRAGSTPSGQGTGQVSAFGTATPTASGLQQGSQSVAPVQSQESRQDAVPFQLRDIPRKSHNQRCSLVFGADQYAFGNVSTGGIDWTTTININAGHWGNPKLVLEVCVAKVPSGRELKKDEYREDQMDLIRYTWIPLVLDNNGYQMIEKLEYENFIDWLKVMPENDIDLPFMQEEALTKERQEKMWTVRGLFGKPIIQQFQDQASWNVLPHALVPRLKTLQTESGHLIRFFFLPRNTNVRVHLPYFARRLSERIPPLNQYYDERGKLQLDNVVDVPSIKAVAGGFFDKGKEDCGTLEKVTEFYSLEQFLIYSALMPIREAQYTKGRYDFMRGDLFECFVLADPDISWPTGNGSRIGPGSEEQKIGNHSYFVYVRLPSYQHNQSPPKAGLRVYLEWDNSNNLSGLKHRNKGGAARIPGTVVQRDDSEFAATRTEFCILIRPRPSQKIPRYHEKLSFEKGLPRAEINVHFNAEPFQRECKAVHDFCSSTRVPVVSLRNLLMDGDQSSPRNDPPLDLRYGFPPQEENRSRFEELLNDCRAALDRAQLGAIESLRRVRNNVVAIEGPPGTGKTTVASVMLWLLAHTDTRVLVCAPSNTATDQVALEASKGLPGVIGNHHLLRLESGSLRRTSSIRQLARKAWDESESATVQTRRSVENDPRIEAAFAELVAEQQGNPDELSAQLKRPEENVEEYAENDDQVEAFTEPSIKQSKVPYAMTMGGNIRRIMAEDQEKAEAEYQADLNDTPEADRHKVKLPKDRNPSAKYADYLQWYLSEEGSIGEAIAWFWTLRETMEKRVLQSTSMLFTTLNNAGSQNFQALGFDPKVVVCDDAGRASLSSLCVPLANFDWEAVILVGDTKQSSPTVLARKASEVAQNSLVSPLEMVKNWAKDVVYLDVQYRMAPSIASFPQRHTYGGR